MWTEKSHIPRIQRIFLSGPGISARDRIRQTYPDAPDASCQRIEEIAFSIKALLEGKSVEFSLDALDWRLCSVFQQAVLHAENRIPRGSVSSYQNIAAFLGNKNRARAVGNALAKNPFPLLVPCHRAVRSDLTLGGFQGGPDMKQALLMAEGIAFDDKRRIRPTSFFFKTG